MSTHVDKAFKELDNTVNETSSRRTRLIALMEATLDKLNLDPNTDSPRMTEVKLATLKTLDDLYKGQENVSMAKVKLALSRIDTQTNANVGQMALEVIKQIEMCDCNKFANTNHSSGVDDDKMLDAVAKDAGIEIDENETSVVVEQAKPRIEINSKEFEPEEE